MKRKLVWIVGGLLAFVACKKDIRTALPLAGKTGLQDNVFSTFTAPEYMVDSIITAYPDNPFGIDHIVQTKYAYNATNQISRIFTYSYEKLINSVIGSTKKDTTVSFYYDNKDITYSDRSFLLKYSTSDDGVTFDTNWDITYTKDSAGLYSSSTERYYLGLDSPVVIQHKYTYPGLNDTDPAVWDTESNAGGTSGNALRKYTLLNGNLDVFSYSNSRNPSGLKTGLLYTYDATKPNQPGDALVINQQLQTYAGSPLIRWKNLTTSVSLPTGVRTLIGDDPEAIGADPEGFYLSYKNVSFSYEFDGKGRVSKITETGIRNLSGKLEVIRTRTIKYLIQ